MRKLRKEEQQLHQTQRLQEETAVSVLQKECKSLRLQNEEFHNQVSQEQQIAFCSGFFSICNYKQLCITAPCFISSELFGMHLHLCMRLLSKMTLSAFIV